MSAQATKVLARDVEQLAADWADWEVLIPDALVDPGPPPEFESTWTMVEAIERDHEQVVFILAGDPPGVRWSVPPDQEVEVRED